MEKLFEIFLWLVERFAIDMIWILKSRLKRVIHDFFQPWIFFLSLDFLIISISQIGNNFEVVDNFEYLAQS